MFDESLQQQPDNELQRLARIEKQKKIDEYRRPFLERVREIQAELKEEVRQQKPEALDNYAAEAVIYSHARRRAMEEDAEKK